MVSFEQLGPDHYQIMNSCSPLWMYVICMYGSYLVLLVIGCLSLADPDFNPKEAKKMEEALKKMEKKEKKTLKGTAKAVGLAARLSPKAQRKKDLLLNSTAQLKVCLIR